MREPVKGGQGRSAEDIFLDGKMLLTMGWIGGVIFALWCIFGGAR